MNRHVPWGTLLRLLGVDVRSAALPARVACPVCGHVTLQVYKDSALGGQWYWCRECQVAGDGIELAARTWQLSAVAAVLKLIGAGVPFPPDVDEARIGRYVAEHIAGRAKAEALWREASATVTPLDGALATFARRLGVPQVRPGDWVARGGQFVGFIQRRKVVECFQPSQYAIPGKSEQGSARIFKGRGWDQLVVIPYRDLPCRLCGLLLIGRNGAYPEDFIYQQSGAWMTKGGDHGLTMLGTFLEPHPAFDGAWFACTDPIEAVRLQLAHLAEHGRALPLVGTWGETPSAAWEYLRGQPTVVFGPDALPADAARLVRHARAAGMAGRAPTGVRPGVSLKAVLASRVNWQSYLEAQLAARTPTAAEELFLCAGLEYGEAARFLRECGPEARAQLKNLADIDRTVRTVELGRTTVSEQDGRWVDARTGDLISDVIVRFDRVVHRRRSGKITLEGTLTRDGRVASFVVEQRSLDAHTAGPWLRETCIKHGLGLPSTANHWASKIISLAHLFHPPAFLETEGVLGWDDTRNRFAFRRFLITDGGEVLPNEEVEVGPAAGLDFDPPIGLVPSQVEALSRTDDATRLLWATAAAVAADAIARCLGLAPGLIAYAGKPAVHALLPAAAAFGCPLVNVIGGRGSGPANTRVRTLQASCAWTIAVTHSDRTSDRIAVDLLPGIFCRVGDWAADILALLGGWTVIDPPYAVATRPLAEYGPAVLPNYLLHFCNNKLHIGTGPLVSAVLEDMASWFAGCGGDPAAVRLSMQIIRPDDTTAFPDRFADLISRIFYEGDLIKAHPNAAARPVRQFTLSSLKGGLLHIPRAGVARALERRDLPHLDHAIVTRHLTTAGILRDDREHDGLPGWVVPEAWWGERYIRWKARDQNPIHTKGD